MTVTTPEYNPVVAKVLKTKRYTPTIAKEFVEQLGSLVAAAPKGCDDLLQANARIQALQVRINDYKKHRGESDAARRPTWLALCQEFNSQFRGFVQYMAKGRPPSAALKLPITDEVFIGELKALLDGKMWLYVCRGCGVEARSTGGWHKSDGFNYCPGCIERYTVQCYECKDRSPRDSLSSNMIVRDNDANTERILCKKCSACGRGQITKKICGGCSVKYVGNPGSYPSYTAEEMKKEKDLELCWKCARTWGRADCGHLTNHIYNLPEYKNIEDDDRDREDVTQAEKTCCNVCRDSYREDEGPEHWEAKVRTVPGKTYDIIKSKRSFGVEIEVCQSKKMRPMPEKIKVNWTSKRDASLPELGVELASTILYGDEGLKTIADLCNYARSHSWSVDTRAGLHLHVGVPDENYETLGAVALGYHMTYDMWTSFVAPSRQRCKYCRRNSYQAKQLALIKGTDIIHRFLNDPSIEGRRCWVNWHSYTTHNTVEIRLHHGSLDYTKISNWVIANTRFVDWCLKQGTAAAVYERMKGKTVRQLFLLTAQEIWKDRPLARWFRGRAKELFDGVAPLPESNRKLRKRGIKPSEYTPGFEFHVGGKRAYIIRVSDRRYFVADNPIGRDGAHVVTTEGWGSHTPIHFTDRPQVVRFLKVAAKDGVPVAVKHMGAPYTGEGLRLNAPRDGWARTTTEMLRAVTRTDGRRVTLNAMPVLTPAEYGFYTPIAMPPEDMEEDEG